MDGLSYTTIINASGAIRQLASLSFGSLTEIEHHE